MKTTVHLSQNSLLTDRDLNRVFPGSPAGIAHSVQRLATGWPAERSEFESQ
jgi:hypothetical protein